jgi:hypothetical protein
MPALATPVYDHDAPSHKFELNAKFTSKTDANGLSDFNLTPEQLAPYNDILKQSVAGFMEVYPQYETLYQAIVKNQPSKALRSGVYLDDNVGDLKKESVENYVKFTIELDGNIPLTQPHLQDLQTNVQFAINTAPGSDALFPSPFERGVVLHNGGALDGPLNVINRQAELIKEKIKTTVETYQGDLTIDQLSIKVAKSIFPVDGISVDSDAILLSVMHSNNGNVLDQMFLAVTDCTVRDYADLLAEEVAPQVTNAPAPSSDHLEPSMSPSFR